jgi:hypothetical protein
MFAAEDQVVRAPLGMSFEVFVVADHEIALAVRRLRPSQAVDDLQVHARESDAQKSRTSSTRSGVVDCSVIAR